MSWLRVEESWKIVLANVVGDVGGLSGLLVYLFALLICCHLRNNNTTLGYGVWLYLIIKDDINTCTGES